MSGALFLGIATLIALGVFLNGLRFARMTRNPFPKRAEGHDASVAQLNRFGRIQMICAPLFWLFILAMTTGLLGPVAGMDPIRF